MYLLNVRQNSSFKLMWIIFILAVPVAGVTFYIYTRLQPGTRFICQEGPGAGGGREAVFAS